LAIEERKTIQSPLRYATVSDALTSTDYEANSAFQSHDKHCHAIVRLVDLYYVDPWLGAKIRGRRGKTFEP
jgi:hypothetical protein